MIYFYFKSRDSVISTYKEVLDSAEKRHAWAIANVINAANRYTKFFALDENGIRHDAAIHHNKYWINEGSKWTKIIKLDDYL